MRDSARRRGFGGVRQVQVNPALVEAADHLLLRQAAVRPAVSPGLHIDPCLSMRGDGGAAAPVRLAGKGHIVGQRHAEYPIQVRIAGPLAFDHVVDAVPFILEQRALRGGDHVAEARRPVTRTAVEAPVIVAKPVDGERVVGDFPHSAVVQLVPEEDAEEQIGSARPTRLRAAWHSSPRACPRLQQAHKIEIEDIMPHVMQGMKEVMVLERIPTRRVALIVFQCHVQNAHVSSFSRPRGRWYWNPADINSSSSSGTDAPTRSWPVAARLRTRLIYRFRGASPPAPV